MLVAASVVVGQGVLCACGRRTWSWFSASIGLATLVVVAGATIRLPGHGATATAAAVVVVVVAVLIAWRRLDEAPALSRVALAVGILVVLAMLLPFAASGGFGAFVGKSNDLGYYLYDAQWLQTHAGFEPPQIAQGYPMGPPALAVVTSIATGGTSLVATFTGFMIAVAVAAALASVTLLERIPPGRRIVGAVLVGLPYMAASFYVQSSFKELAIGLFALTFALLLRQVVGEGAPTAPQTHSAAEAIPLALLAAAGVYTYSFAGLYWPAGILVVWGIASALIHGRELRTWIAQRRWVPQNRRRLAIFALIVVAVVVALTVPAWSQVTDFFKSRGSLSALSGGSVKGDLPGTPWFYTALGVWPVTDYRGTPPNMLLERLWFVVAFIVFARGVFELAIRRQIAVLAGLLIAGSLYLAARWGSGPYVQSKALAVMAPTVMLIAVFGALSAPGEIRPAGWMRDRTWPRIPGRARSIASFMVRGPAALVFCAGALLSSYLALGGALINSGAQARELEALGHTTHGSRVLFLGSDDYVGWELRGSSVLGSDRHNGVFRIPPKPGPAQTWPRYDFDSLTPHDLDVTDYVITSRSPVMSAPPGNFERVAQTQSFVLWKRTGPTEPRRTLAEGPLPGHTLRCDSASGRRISGLDGVAEIWSRAPVYGSADAWRSSTPPPSAGGHHDPNALTQDRSVTQSLDLGKGRWTISLQYTSAKPMDVKAPGLDVRLPAMFQRLGPQWPVGTIDVQSSQEVPVTVTLAPRSGLEDALAGPDRLDTGAEGRVAGIVATAADVRTETVPLRDACGHFVDWYRVS